MEMLHAGAPAPRLLDLLARSDAVGPVAHPATAAAPTASDGGGADEREREQAHRTASSSPGSYYGRASATNFDAGRRFVLR